MKLAVLFQTILAVIFAFSVGGVFILLHHSSPMQVYKALYDYGLGSWFSLSNTLNASFPLILTGLSASVAFMCGVVNLGQHGQFLWGALVCAVCGIYLKLPGWFGVTFLALLGGIAGATWAGLAAFFRKRYRMDEFISTLMLNFLAEYSTLYLATYPFLDPKAYVPSTKLIRREYFMTSVFDVNLAFFVALFMVFLCWFFVWKTWRGYESRMMGYNKLFATVGGCDVEVNTTSILLISGFLSGLAGALIILGGTQHRFMKGIGANFGWDGVMIAIMANNQIFQTLFYALFMGFLKNGAVGMEFETSVPSEFVLFLQAVIVLTLVGTRSGLVNLMDWLKAKKELRKLVR
ncbi:ABC transporter permease [Pseudothermotoga sp.]|nr:ABC transporter permease [Pseudothermotoga sp.]MCX7812051.1 ABC transporter permease [Pseudothermotoga sp.]MDW8139121.1 ABC transporter permease [Pseudothermotoga sp.]